MFSTQPDHDTSQQTPEGQFEALVASIPEGIALYEIGDQPRVLYFNDAAAALLGYTREEYQSLSSEGASALLYEEDRPHITEQIGLLCAGELDQVSCVCRGKHHNGTLHRIRVRAAVMRRENALTLISVAFSDAAEVLSARQALSYYRDAAFSIFDEMVELDMTTQCATLLYSRNCSDPSLLGVAGPLEEVNARWLEQVDPRDRASVQRFLRFDWEEIEPQELVYRLKRSDTVDIWCAAILFRIGEKKFICCNRDVSAYMKREATSENSTGSLAMQREQERHRIIIEKLGAAIFDWDFSEKIFYNSKRYRCYAMSQTNPEQFFWNTPKLEGIFAGDRSLAESCFFELRDGGEKAETVLRLLTEDGFRWSRISLYAASRNGNQLERVIGWIEDVQEQREQEFALRAKAEFDPITGLFNRTTAVERITQRMQRPVECGEAMLIIMDVDNFKRTNSTYGHLMGDRLLSAIGAIIRASIRESDLVGRMGGDEFLILLTHIPLETAIEKLQSLAEKVRRIAKRLSLDDAVTVSIGVCQTHDADGSFDDTFEKADRALYRAKSQGMGLIEIYQPGEHA